MNPINGYLKKIQEYGYEHPIQTRPKSSPGITGEDPEKEIIPGTRGPAGSTIDLEKQKEIDIKKQRKEIP